MDQNGLQPQLWMIVYNNKKNNMILGRNNQDKFNENWILNKAKNDKYYETKLVKLVSINEFSVIGIEYDPYSKIEIGYVEFPILKSGFETFSSTEYYILNRFYLFPITGLIEKNIEIVGKLYFGNNEIQNVFLKENYLDLKKFQKNDDKVIVNNTISKNSKISSLIFHWIDHPYDFNPKDIIFNEALGSLDNFCSSKSPLFFIAGWCEKISSYLQQMFIYISSYSYITKGHSDVILWWSYFDGITTWDLFDSYIVHALRRLSSLFSVSSDLQTFKMLLMEIILSNPTLLLSKLYDITKDIKSYKGNLLRNCKSQYNFEKFFRVGLNF